eukprot:scaffold1379_cov390-Prasinococcus_capsulatus_cf.AAC.3
MCRQGEVWHCAPAGSSGSVERPTRTGLRSHVRRLRSVRPGTMGPILLAARCFAMRLGMTSPTVTDIKPLPHRLWKARTQTRFTSCSSADILARKRASRLNEMTSPWNLLIWTSRIRRGASLMYYYLLTGAGLALTRLAHPGGMLAGDKPLWSV